MSPMTRAGSSPRASAGRGAAARRSPARRCSAPRATTPGAATTSGAPRGRRRATTGSPVSAADRRPCTLTRSRQRTPDHCSSPMTSSGVCTRLRVPRPVTSVTVSLSTAVCPVRPPRSTGSVATTPSTVTTARAAARVATGPASRAMPWAPEASSVSAAAPADRPSQAAAPVSGPSRPPPLGRRVPGSARWFLRRLAPRHASAPARSTPASASRPWAGHASVAAAAVQPPIAGSSSRRSGTRGSAGRRLTR